MANFFYAMEETSLNNFVAFKMQMEKLQSLATPAQIDKVRAEFQSLSLASGQSFDVDEQTGIAVIHISGTLTPRAEICTSLSDGSQTLYSTVVQAVHKAEQAPSVKEIYFDIDSHGGFISGLDIAALAIKNCTKATTARVTGSAFSAAYWLASQCDKIIALTPLAEFGSVGVLMEGVDRSAADEKEGLKRYVLTSQNAPEKFQNIATKEGRDKILFRINEMESIFLARVAEGRAMSVDDVKAKFGRGNVMIAKEALAAGMIDAIAEDSSILPKDNNLSTEENKKTKGVSMSLQELLNQNPKAKAEHESSISAAVDGERTRVTKLMNLSGVLASDELTAAINGGIKSGAYAENQLAAQNKVRDDAAAAAATAIAAGKSPLGKVKSSAQVPGDTSMDDTAAAAEEQDKDVITTPEQAEAAAKKLYPEGAK